MTRPVLTVPRVGPARMGWPLAAGQQALQSLEVLCPDGLLVVCHRRCEVITRRVHEIDPFRHGSSLPVRRSRVHASLSREVHPMP